MSEYLKRLVLAIQAGFNDFDSIAWRYEPDSCLEHSPIFIVGAPRTGSTLLYQTLLQRYNLAYISNAMALLPNQMLKMCRIWKGVGRDFRGSLHPGRHGYLPGLLGPNEGGKIFRRWFDENDSEERKELTRRTFSALTSILGAPVLTKNPNNSLRIRRIRDALPSARFVYLRREPLYTAQSILICRKELGAEAARWWSVEVPGYEKTLREDPCYQVVWQVTELNRIVERDLSGFANVVELSYEQFCRAPDTVFELIENTFGLERLPEAPAKRTRFTESNRQRLDPEEWEKLEYFFRRMSERGG